MYCLSLSTTPPCPGCTEYVIDISKATVVPSLISLWKTGKKNPQAQKYQ